jgi:hypothetical protein
MIFYAGSMFPATNLQLEINQRGTNNTRYGTSADHFGGGTSQCTLGRGGRDGVGGNNVTSGKVVGAMYLVMDR